MHLRDGRAAPAQQFPNKFGQAIANGILAQKEQCETQMCTLFCITPDQVSEDKEIPQRCVPAGAQRETVNGFFGAAAARPSTPEEDCTWQTAWDDAAGAELDPKMIKEVREQDIEHLRKAQVYRKVPRPQVQGKATTVRRVDANKSDDKTPNDRSRFVAREVNTKANSDAFAATPPTETLKRMIVLAALRGKGQQRTRIIVQRCISDMLLCQGREKGVRGIGRRRPGGMRRLHCGIIAVQHAWNEMLLRIGRRHFPTCWKALAPERAVRPLYILQ